MLEVQHCQMWAVYRADAEADDGPVATFWSEEMANDFAVQKHVPEDEKIGADLCVLPCQVEIVIWNNYADPGEGRLVRAAALLGHDDPEREELIASEQP